jgi:hypothetical protein
MRVFKNAVLIVLVVVPAVIQSGCGGYKNDLCCLEYSPGSDQATYCNNFRNAALKFIDETVNKNMKEDRLDEFRAFYHVIEKCRTAECVDSAVDAANYMPGFKELYDNERWFSERDTDVSDSQKAELILCGFRDAIEIEESRLRRESNK